MSNRCPLELGPTCVLLARLESTAGLWDLRPANRGWSYKVRSPVENEQFVESLRRAA